MRKSRNCSHCYATTPDPFPGIQSTLPGGGVPAAAAPALGDDVFLAAYDRPMSEDLLTLREAAELFDPPKTIKAMQQLVHRHRDNLIVREQKVGQGNRVWTSRAAVAEYAARAGLKLREQPASEQSVTPTREEIARIALAEGVWRRPRIPLATEPAEPVEPWRSVMEDLAEENLQLRLRVAELEAELRVRR